MKTLIEEQYYSDQLEYLQDGHILVRTQFPKGEWVYGYILSFGHFVEVLEPEYIREIISESAEKIKKIYQP
jgi:predicted DNA-binding transcriptional regulator YafY